MSAQKKHILAYSCAVAVLANCSNAWAGAFYLHDQSAALSAGAVAGNEEASGLFYNPATLSMLKSRKLESNLMLYNLSVKLKDEGSKAVGGAAALKGNDGGNAGALIPIPSLFFSSPINKNLSFGMGIFTPFGLGVNYGNGSKWRYHITKANLASFNFNPSLAWQITENFSLGAGISAQAMTVDMAKSMDYGALSGATPQSNDINAAIKAKSIGYGFNVGALFHLTPATRLGISYRSPINQKIKKDDVRFQPSAAAGGAFANTKAKTLMKMPGSLMFGAVHDLTSQLSLRASMLWQNWGQQKEIRWKFQSGLPDDVMPLHYRNTMRFDVGAVYKATNALALSGGFLYDQTPTRNRYRHPMLPDADKFGLSLGAIYQAASNISLKAGYSHFFVKKAPLNFDDAKAGLAKARAKSSLDLFALQLNLKI